MENSAPQGVESRTICDPTNARLTRPPAEPRRSISIFSRRGIETPEPSPVIFEEPMPALRQLTERQRGRLKKTKSHSGASSPMSPDSSTRAKKPRATVLKALPRANSRSVTVLESAIATRPESQGRSGPHGNAAESHAHARPSSAGALIKSAWKGNAALHSSHREQSQKRRSAEHRVGVWVEGVTEWDAAIQYRAVLDEPSIPEENEGTTVRRVPVKAAATLGVRPNLSVIIPGSQPIADTTQVTMEEPEPRTSPELVSLPLSKFNTMAPSLALEESPQDSSPKLESAMQSPTLDPRTMLVDSDAAGKPGQLSVSRTSSKSSSEVDDGSSSVYSKRSSATSLEVGPKLGGGLKRRLSGNMLVDMLGGPSVKRASPKCSETKPADIDPPADENKPAEVSKTVEHKPVEMSKPADVNKPLPPAPVLPPLRDPPQVPPGLDTGGALRQTKSTASAPDGIGARYRSRKAASRSRSWTHLDIKFDVFDLQFMATAPHTPSPSAPSSPTLTQAEDALEAHLSGLTETSQEPLPEDWATKIMRADLNEPRNQVQDLKDTFQGTTVEAGGVNGEPVIAPQKDSVRAVMNPPKRAPTLPKRSRKREWRMPSRGGRVTPLAAPKGLTRRKSASEATPLRDQATAGSLIRSRTVADLSTHRRATSELIPPLSHLLDTSGKDLQASDELDTFKEVCVPGFVFDDGLIVVQGPVIIGEDGREMRPNAVAAATAEEVLLHIFSSLDSTADLLNTAMINKGMYRVFKENEMQLIRMVTFNESPAAWELREWCPPQQNALGPESSKSSSLLEHTPKTYVQCHWRDARAIEKLKATLLRECSTCIRRDTAAALSDPSSPDNRRINDALWRIWCFCKIFGCEKGREDDFAGQLDWLKGGVLANNQQGFSATVNTNWDYDMNSVLFNPPEYFAKGNGGGLSAEQLYDMTEIWTCLTTVLQGYQGRVMQARVAGIFDDCDIEEGDQEKEELMLEEWIYYLLTLGPNVVLEMATYATNSSSAGFAHAKENAWTIWSPPQSTCSRRTFLKEPVSRLYEERISAATISTLNPREQLAKQIAKKRVASLAAEIKLARQKSAYRRSPYIDMSTERPMSMASRSNSTSSALSSNNTPYSVSIFAANLRTPLTPTLTSASPSPSPSLKWCSPRRISPIVEGRRESFARLSLQKRSGRTKQDPSRVAMRRIMDMGFSTDQAIWALKRTGGGDGGLRVDAAVDLLLRQRG
ncbi:hypothetical protein Tdes44962_MAKER01214 [Teratosphaeria destructans]|uniref:UBA domain-containing protein n=1 Tax=Teratosphaeria destructans TaxID=418781 RepID=A0A9W7T1Z3_9PEZI|nr:hypothetical protein Tdes44962_MAKER01214 [Teratosphaeria destructans]